MLKIFASIALFVSFLTYGQSSIQEKNEPSPVNKEFFLKVEHEIGVTEQKQMLIDTNEKILYELIGKNNQSIELLTANQAKLINEISEIKDNVKVDYSGWTSILLACVGIIITIISLMLAVISIIGYRNFKKSIELSAKKISTEVAKSETTIQIDAVAKKELVRLIDEGALAKHLESAVDMIFLRRKPEQKESGFDKYPELDKEDSE
ncbi:hypothetical protein ACONW8_001199 [Yersinia enterocolitica]